MFADYAKITVRSGDGGNGCVSFHREKYAAPAAAAAISCSSRTKA